jgi:hypothetical protein
MFEENPKRKNLVTKLSFIPLLMIIAWICVTQYTVRSGTSYPDPAAGRTYSIPYKGGPLYLTAMEYFLSIGLILGFFLSAPMIILITSPALGLFKYDQDDERRG